MAWFALAGAGCKGCHERHDTEADRATEEGDDPDEQDDNRDNFWRVKLALVGRGRVATDSHVLDCISDGTTQVGKCGPQVFVFVEREPPLLRATAPPGWHLARWESLTLEPNGTTRPRAGAMPDGDLYLNGFGYSDTGELETVTAIFVAVPADAGSGGS